VPSIRGHGGGRPVESRTCGRHRPSRRRDLAVEIVAGHGAGRRRQRVEPLATPRFGRVDRREDVRARLLLRGAIRLRTLDRRRRLAFDLRGGVDRRSRFGHRRRPSVDLDGCAARVFRRLGEAHVEMGGVTVTACLGVVGAAAEHGRRRARGPGLRRSGGAIRAHLAQPHAGGIERRSGVRHHRGPSCCAIVARDGQLELQHGRLARDGLTRLGPGDAIGRGFLEPLLLGGRVGGGACGVGPELLRAPTVELAPRLVLARFGVEVRDRRPAQTPPPPRRP
jgi:hypothetical protein